MQQQYGASNALLGLAAAGVGDEERAVVCEQNVLQLLLGRLVHVLLEVRHNALGDRLAQRCGRAGQGQGHTKNTAYGGPALAV